MKERKIDAWTGRGGAIMFHETLLGRPLTQEEKNQIEPGMYKLGGDTGIEYLGLEDKSQKDGTALTKYTDRGWYIEQWEGGWRVAYEKVSEEKAEELIKLNNNDNEQE